MKGVLSKRLSCLCISRRLQRKHTLRCLSMLFSSTLCMPNPSPGTRTLSLKAQSPINCFTTTNVKKVFIFFLGGGGGGGCWPINKRPLCKHYHSQDSDRDLAWLREMMGVCNWQEEYWLKACTSPILRPSWHGWLKKHRGWMAVGAWWWHLQSHKRLKGTSEI